METNVMPKGTFITARRRILVLTLAGCGVFCALVLCRHRSVRESQLECAGCLNTLEFHIKLYASENDGRFPANIAELLKWSGAEQGFFEPLLLCPRPRETTNSPRSVEEWMVTADEWMDYIYVPWQNPSELPGNYPLIYDRRLANHKGKGINIVLLNGQVMWDRNAQYLKEFIKEHPDLDVPLPEELASPHGEP